eukprot:gene29481-5827_t
MASSPFSNPCVKALPDVADVTALLYLNPELQAYSNLLTAEEALLTFDAYAMLPNTVPDLPMGFNPKVFIASQRDVSTLNRAIRDAMVAADSISVEGLDRMGTFVGTIMCRATFCMTSFLMPEVDVELEFNLELPEDTEQQAVFFSSSVAQVGDHLRIECKINRHNPLRGPAFLDCEVSRVSYAERRLCVRSAPLNRQRGATFNVFGIKVYDPLRQARISYARVSSPLPPSEASPDVVPSKRFVYDMYQLMYPETRGYTVSDTYIEYRSKWTRGSEYRLQDGSDIFNLSAPSNNTGLCDVSEHGYGYGYVRTTYNSSSVGYVDGGNFFATESNAGMCSNLLVTPSLAYVSSHFIFGSSFSVGASNGMLITADAASFGFGNLLVESSNAVRVLTDLNVGATLGVGTSNPVLKESGVRLSVGGDVFTTGAVVSLSDRGGKRNFEGIDQPLHKLCSLEGCTYNVLLTDGSGAVDFRRRHTGLVAQDVLRVLPEAVYDTPDGRKSVAYGNLTGLVVEAVKELVDRVERIEIRMDNLMGRNGTRTVEWCRPAQA